MNHEKDQQGIDFESGDFMDDPIDFDDDVIDFEDDSRGSDGTEIDFDDEGIDFDEDPLDMDDVTLSVVEDSETADSVDMDLPDDALTIDEDDSLLDDTPSDDASVDEEAPIELTDVVLEGESKAAPEIGSLNGGPHIQRESSELEPPVPEQPVPEQPVPEQPVPEQPVPELTVPEPTETVMAAREDAFDPSSAPLTKIDEAGDEVPEAITPLEMDAPSLSNDDVGATEGTGGDDIHLQTLVEQVIEKKLGKELDALLASALDRVLERKLTQLKKSVAKDLLK